MMLPLRNDAWLAMLPAREGRPGELRKSKTPMKTELRAQIQPSISTIREAQKFLAKHFAATQLIAAPFLTQHTKKNVYLKLETELPTGSFKMQKAFYALTEKMKKSNVLEVVASSTRNHKTTIAYAAKEFSITAKIFLPTNCNPV